MRELNECWLVARAAACPGALVAGKCPGSSAVQCCTAPAPAATPFGPTAAELANPVGRAVLLGDRQVEILRI